MSQTATKQKLVIRCSALPRILQCPGSITPPETTLVVDRGVAQLGRAAHEALALLVKKSPVDLTAIAKKYEVPEKQLAPLYHIGRHSWAEYEEDVAVAACEQRMSREILPGVILAGSADIILRVISAKRPTLLVWDWKSGAISDHRDQVIGYGWLVIEDWPAEHMKAGICWLRDQIVEIEDIDIAEINRLPERIQEALNHPNHFSPNFDACKYCPRQHECPAYIALIRQIITAFSSGDIQVNSLAPAELSMLYNRVQFLKKFLEHYDDVLRNQITLSGALPIGDGRIISLQPRERKSIITEKALPFLQERLGGPEELFPAISINKNDLIGIVRDRAPRGQKKAAQEALMSDLADAGAIDITPYSRLTVSKKEEEGNNDDK
jgi:hypothetical protein